MHDTPCRRSFGFRPSTVLPGGTSAMFAATAPVAVPGLAFRVWGLGFRMFPEGTT